MPVRCRALPCATLTRGVPLRCRALPCAACVRCLCAMPVRCVCATPVRCLRALPVRASQRDLLFPCSVFFWRIVLTGHQDAS